MVSSPLTSSGNTFSTSCAITPAEDLLVSFQLNVTPRIWITFANESSICWILVFKLKSESESKSVDVVTPETKILVAVKNPTVATPI